MEQQQWDYFSNSAYLVIQTQFCLLFTRLHRHGLLTSDIRKILSTGAGGFLIFFQFTNYRPQSHSLFEFPDRDRDILLVISNLVMIYHG